MTGLREAGAAISGAGLVDKVTRAPEAATTTRQPETGARGDAEARYDEREPDPAPVDDDADPITDDEPDDSGDETDARSDSEPGEDADTPAETLHTVTVDGKPTKVTTEELVRGYQRQADYSRKTAALADRTRALNEAHAKAAEDIRGNLARGQALVARVRQDLLGDMNSQEMTQLRRTDPAEYQRLRWEYEDRVAAVNGYFQAITQELERHDAAAKQQRDTLSRDTIAAERAKVLSAIPDWDTADVGGEAGSARLARYLTDAGFQLAELDGLTDARQIIIADKARRYDELQASRKAQPAKPAPKHIPAGGGQIAKNGNAQGRRSYETARTKAAKTGDLRDAGAAIAHMFRTRA